MIACTDGTLEVLEKIQSLDSRIKIARTLEILEPIGQKTSVLSAAIADLSTFMATMI